MPKIKSSALTKINSIIAKFPTEFIKTPTPDLFCNICSCVVQCDKQYKVDRHRQSAKHQKGLPSSSSSTSQSAQTFIDIPSKDFTYNVTRAFLAADIPLKSYKTMSYDSFLKIWERNYRLRHHVGRK